MILNGLFDKHQPVAPGRTGKIVSGTNASRLLYIHAADGCLFASLCQHERYESCSRADIEYRSCLTDVGPSAEQHTVGAYRVYARILLNEELLESKRLRHRALF